MQTAQFYTPSQRTVLKVVLLFFLLLLLGAAATIPFLWESTSLWYKFGFDKTLLQTGKIAGLTAAILLFMQPLLASRTVLFDKIFGLDRIYLYHRINGFVIITAALLHVSLVIIPEGIQNLPIGWKFWPEMLGAAMLFTLLPFVLLASLHKKILPYHLWRVIHRFMGYLFLAPLSIHILYVSDSFSRNVPKYSFFLFAGTILFVVATNKYRTLRQSSQRLRLESKQPLHDTLHLLKVAMPPTFTYAPGQFVFVTLRSPNGRAEPHPFTIASAPLRNNSLHFMIKKSGDWTANIADAHPDHISIEGPYGLFSYKANKATDTINFIAAGIGITPMLSMLRQIAMETDQPQTTLLWSLRTKKEMFLQQELDTLATEISSFHLHMVYTREKGGGRINRQLLGQLFGSRTQTGHYYICGPPQMISATRKNLLELGVPKKHIFQEKFAF
jgi:predicted ferric reductase